MYLAKKVRLLPTPEQEILFWKSAGIARWTYNQFLEQNFTLYSQYLLNGKCGQRKVSEGAFRRELTKLKHTTHQWLAEVSNNVVKQAVKDANTALERFYKKLSKKPKFKSRKKSKPSFYVNYESLQKKLNGFQGERLGLVKTTESLPKIPKDSKYLEPRISYDGKYWYLSVSYEVKPKKCILTNNSLGIDLGIKSLAVVSNQDSSYNKVYKNINKTRTVKNLTKRLKRVQRKASRKLNLSKSSKKPIQECKNLTKQYNFIRQIYRRISNIRMNHLHQTTTEIVKTKPFQIVLEDLNVSGMMKNRHLSKAIAEQCFYKFRHQIEYKCKLYGIELVIADRFFPSSKTCSQCGSIKTDLKLSDRTYICSHCGNIIDRDLNAAINLANYNT